MIHMMLQAFWLKNNGPPVISELAYKLRPKCPSMMYQIYPASLKRDLDPVPLWKV
jgi:hypothetical protein